MKGSCHLLLSKPIDKFTFIKSVHNGSPVCYIIFFWTKSFLLGILSIYLFVFTYIFMYEYLLIYHSHIFTLRKKHNHCVLCVKKFVYVRFVLILGKILTAIAMVCFFQTKKRMQKMHIRIILEFVREQTNDLWHLIIFGCFRGKINLLLYIF